MMKLLLNLLLVSIVSAKIRLNRHEKFIQGKEKKQNIDIALERAIEKETQTLNSDVVLEQAIAREQVNNDNVLEQAIEKEALSYNNTEPPKKRYAPNWADLDTRPLPEWYDRAKVGIFLHWGVYSVPSFGSEWFWSNWKGGDAKYENFMNQAYSPGFTYQEFAPMFKAEFFNPQSWAALFAKAGAKYVILTSKHHEGFTMFPSRRSFSWNSMDVGPKRDIVGELSQAVRANNMKFGVYHSLYEWYNPEYLEDKKSLFQTQSYSLNKVWPDIKQLVNDYEPSVIWSDGDWEALDTYWNSTDLIAWLYNDSPVKDEIVVNDRWGIGIPCHHGDFYNCADRYNPGTLQNHKWENAFTVDSKSWGYRRNMELNEILCINQLIEEVVSTVSCGGNVLINVGPTKEGTIAPIFQERLLNLGLWLSVNGEAIYETSPWYHQNDTTNGDVWYTCTKSRYDGMNPTAAPLTTDKVTAIYAIILRWPVDDVLKIEDISSYLRQGIYKTEMLGNNSTAINWKVNKGITYIHLPPKNTVASRHAWVLKFSTK